jgi:hypothetical protein
MYREGDAEVEILIDGNLNSQLCGVDDDYGKHMVG